MKYLSKLKIRTVDSHTIFLGIDSHWSRLTLPWISRDIGLLIGQIEEPNQKDDDPLERLSALKICLTQLSVTYEKSLLSTSDNSNIVVKKADSFYQEAKVIEIKELHNHSESSELIVTTNISELLIYEETIQKHLGVISILVYSDQAVILGPILRGEDYCLFCYRYLLAIPFGLRVADRESEENRFLELGLRLGAVVQRDTKDTLLFDGKDITVKPFLPFVGCPTCFEKSS
ncbi:MAG: hypothetical protein DSZ11_00370 [Sulfurovum sp.]|nr:MAG: hypothetical protein DSZ11_00370 [Sulfurovum sp.]